MSSPAAGFFRRAVPAVLAAPAVAIAAYVLLRSPVTAARLEVLPPVLLTETGAALLALGLGFGLGILLAALLLREPDRAAGAALAALQGEEADADESGAGAERNDLGTVAARLAAWRDRARRAEQAHRRLEEALARVVAAIGETSLDEARPLRSDPDHGPAEQALTDAVNGLLDAARRSRESAAVLLGRIEENLDQARQPLEEADRRMTAGSAALDRSLAAMSRALAVVVRAADAAGGDRGAEGPDPLRAQLEDAVRESYEARFALEQCLAAMGRAQRVGGHAEREIAAVRRRLGGRDVKHLSEADFVTDDSREREPEAGE